MGGGKHKYSPSVTEWNVSVFSHCEEALFFSLLHVLLSAFPAAQAPEAPPSSHVPVASPSPLDFHKEHLLFSSATLVPITDPPVHSGQLSLGLQSHNGLRYWLQWAFVLVALYERALWACLRLIFQKDTILWPYRDQHFLNWISVSFFPDAICPKLLVKQWKIIGFLISCMFWAPLCLSVLLSFPFLSSTIISH